MIEFMCLGDYGSAVVVLALLLFSLSSLLSFACSPLDAGTFYPCLGACRCKQFCNFIRPFWATIYIKFRWVRLPPLTFKKNIKYHFRVNLVILKYIYMLYRVISIKVCNSCHSAMCLLFPDCMCQVEGC